MFLREKERIRALENIESLWLCEQDFTECTGFSASYFHKIATVFKSAGSRDIKFERNPGTNREKVFVKKPALISFLSHHLQRRKGNTKPYSVQGSVPELLAQLRNDCETEQGIIKTLTDMANEIKKASSLIERQKERFEQLQQHKAQLIEELLQIKLNNV